MSLESLAEIFGLAPLNGLRKLTLSCARCLSQITASEADGRVRFTCAGGCTEDELIGALAEVEPAFADWWLSGGLTSNRELKIGEGPPRADEAATPEALDHPESHDSDEGGGDAYDGLERPDNARAAGLDEAGGSANNEGGENDGRGIKEGIQGSAADDPDGHLLMRGYNSGRGSQTLETQMPRQRLPNEASVSSNEEDENAAADNPEDTEPHLNGQVSARRPDLQSWKMMLYALGQQGIEKLIAQGHRETIAVQEIDAFVTQVERLRNLPKIWQTNDPQGLSETEIAEEAMTVAVALRNHYAPTTSNGDSKPLPPTLIIKSKQENATIMNAEYLARPEIIEKLGYSQSIALAIGGKHHGKTTNVRTLALSVLRGLPIWGRQTTQGAVIYAASDDELASTRNELLTMGWERGEGLTLVHVNPEVDASREQILEDIGKAAIQEKAVLIILDMLFDFVSIGNELSYAETRRAINAVQKLADDTKALVVGTHHTPKYLNDAHNATNAALGSQGISARFSPIILTRKWAETLYTVESTTVRDPRGEALKPLKIIKNSQGWIETAGEFKEWMKWEIYAARVLELFENNKGQTVYSIAEKLGIDRSRAQNTVKELTNAGKLRREKEGRIYRYYLGSSNMFEREGGNWSERN